MKKNVSVFGKKNFDLWNKAMEAYEIFGTGENIAYLDLKEKNYLAITKDPCMYDEDDVKNRRKIERSPKRYIPIPIVEASDDYELMEEFAFNSNDPQLIAAIQSDHPMSAFNTAICSSDKLRGDWLEFRETWRYEQLKKWAKKYGIDCPED